MEHLKNYLYKTNILTHQVLKNQSINFLGLNFDESEVINLITYIIIKLYFYYNYILLLLK